MEFDYPKRELDLISPKNSIRINQSSFLSNENLDILEETHMLSSAYINLAEINFDEISNEI